MKGKIIDLGQMDYKEAWNRQLEAVEIVLAGGKDTLIFVEHPPVLTLGANFHESNLLLNTGEYSAMGIEIVKTDRGGDVTYHGPGQLVIYPIFDVSRHGKDLHRWMRDLEEVMLQVLQRYGLSGRRFEGFTGAWIEDEKIAAIGVKIRRWVSLHGIALNCNNGTEGFEGIVPCGISGYGVTSLTHVLGREVEVDEVKPRVIEAFSSVFNLEFD